MAARKSCTHLTWAEAKARTGQGAPGVKKNKQVLRKQDHGAVLAAKIISKQQGGNASDNRKLEKAYRKQEEKSQRISALRQEEREKKRLEKLCEVKPTDLARRKAYEMLNELAANEKDEIVPEIDGSMSEEIQDKIVQCKELQLDEIMALEAMIPEEDLVLSQSTSIVRDLRESTDHSPDSSTSTSQRKHISFLIKLEVEHRVEDMDLSAVVLIKVTLPSLYLCEEEQQTPKWDFPFVMVTDTSSTCSADKALESLAVLSRDSLQEEMEEQAKELLPYPCVYELAITWLSEHLFEFLKLQSHLLASKQNILLELQ